MPRVVDACLVLLACCLLAGCAEPAGEKALDADQVPATSAHAVTHTHATAPAPCEAGSWIPGAIAETSACHRPESHRTGSISTWHIVTSVVWRLLNI